MQYGDLAALERLLVRAREGIEFVQNRIRPDLDRDRMLALGVCGQLTLVGRVAGFISQDTRNAMPEMRWDEIVDRGARLIREYDAVDYDDVWRALTEELPAMVPVLERALAERG